MKNLYRITSAKCKDWFVEATSFADAERVFGERHPGDPITDITRTNKLNADEIF